MMIMKKSVFIFFAVVLAFPIQAKLIFDMSGVDEKDFTYDKYQCEQLASQVEKEKSSGVLGGAVKGAAVGAGVGAAGKAVAGGSGSDGAKKGAGVGVAVGALSSRRDKKTNDRNYEIEKENVLRNCMVGRGYTVLN